MAKAYIREIFLSIQGEGPYVGEEQLFIRFCGCNMNCAYCDTDFEFSKSKEYTPQELLTEITKYNKPLVLSLTGGEPLVSVEFLEEFLPLAKKYNYKIYLETNATLPKALEKVINYTDIISADIKLQSATEQKIDYETYDSFFQIASQKETFAKIVFNKNITPEEILQSISIGEKYSIPLILQPEMNGCDFCITTDDIEFVFKTFRSKYEKVRLIPQMHKFLNIR